jgi:hypothetical protein
LGSNWNIAGGIKLKQTARIIDGVMARRDYARILQERGLNPASAIEREPKSLLDVYAQGIAANEARGAVGSILEIGKDVRSELRLHKNARRELVKGGPSD